MFCRLFTKVLPATFFLISVVQSYELSGKAERPLANLLLQRHNDKLNNDGFMHLLEGILLSENFNKHAISIPCHIVQQLETNGDEAGAFVTAIVNHETPKIIKGLSENENIQHAFADWIHRVYELVTNTPDIPAATAMAAMDSFNGIESKTSKFDFHKKEEALSDINSIFVGFTDFLTAAHATKSCLATSLTSTKNIQPPIPVTSTPSVEKPTSRTASKQNSTHRVTPPTVSASSYLPTSAVSNISRSFSPVPSSIPEPQSANLGTRTTSRPFESKSIGICAVTILGVLGLAVFL